MTYKDRFVAEVKSNGQILRVRDGFVTLPFGSEYSLLLKNLNSRRAVVKISIDGKDVLDNTSLVLNPDESTELMGFMRNMAVRNRFKFIKKTKEIVEHRGDRIDDGMIRIEFAYEKPKPKIREIINEHHDNYYRWPTPYYYPKRWDVFYHNSSNNIRGMTGESLQYSNTVLNNVNACDAPENVSKSCFNESLATPIEDMGITVKGSETYQGFNYTSVGQTEEAEVIVIRMKGSDSKGQVVSEPITTRQKLKCETCGRQSSSQFKFCPHCGTFLE